MAPKKPFLKKGEGSTSWKNSRQSAGVRTRGQTRQDAPLELPPTKKIIGPSGTDKEEDEARSPEEAVLGTGFMLPIDVLPDTPGEVEVKRTLSTVAFEGLGEAKNEGEDSPAGRIFEEMLEMPQRETVSSVSGNSTLTPANTMRGMGEPGVPTPAMIQELVQASVDDAVEMAVQERLEALSGEFKRYLYRAMERQDAEIRTAAEKEIECRIAAFGKTPMAQGIPQKRSAQVF